jgi:hypothetical protein
VVGAEFERIQAGSDFEVSWALGSPCAKIEAGAERLKSIRIDLVDGVLIVVDESLGGWSGKPPRIEVSSAALRGVDLSGAASFDAVAIDSQNFKAELGGASRAALKGRCLEAHWRVSGAAQADASNLACQALDVELAGAGKFDGIAETSCRARIAGAARASVGGDASWDIEVEGSGSLAQTSGAARACKARLSGSSSLRFVAAGPCDLSASGASQIDFEALPGVPVSSLAVKASGAARIDCRERSAFGNKAAASRAARR